MNYYHYHVVKEVCNSEFTASSHLGSRSALMKYLVELHYGKCKIQSLRSSIH